MTRLIKTNWKGVLTLLTIAVLISCGNDEDNGPSYNFIDQPLQGKIGGAEFVMKDGRIEEGFFDENWYFYIYDQDEDGSACDVDSPVKNHVLFTVPLEVGIYKLYLKLSNFTGQTVTLYDTVEEINNIATTGGIEILSITESEITGRMDAKYDNQNFVNGNFTVSICPTDLRTK